MSFVERLTECPSLAVSFYPLPLSFPLPSLPSSPPSSSIPPFTPTSLFSSVSLPHLSYFPNVTYAPLSFPISNTALSFPAFPNATHVSLPPSSISLSPCGVNPAPLTWTPLASRVSRPPRTPSVVGTHLGRTPSPPRQGVPRAATHSK